MNSVASSAQPVGPSLSRHQRYVAILLGAMVAAMAMLAASVAQAQITTATTLTLSSSSGPLSSGSSVTAGTVVTFTASVTDPSPVTTGLVSFCDLATNSYCDNSALIGTAQLLSLGTSLGTAVIKLVPGTGSHSYVAVFNGTPNGTTANAASTSLAQALTVTGYRTTTSISSSGSAGSYNLTGTVIGWGNSSAGPTGTVSFVDTTNSNYVLGLAALGTATLGQPFGMQSTQTAGSGPYAVATGDLRGIGIADLVGANCGSDTVSVLLGNGDGTFQTASNIASESFNCPISVTIADFNGDGLPDLAIANWGGESVSVLLGDGTGGFTEPTSSPYAVGNTPFAAIAADFNGDGIADLVVPNYSNGDAGTVSVLLGIGNGSFQSQVTYAVGDGPRSVAVGDFNGDGFPDLAVANYGNGSGSTPGTVSVLLNSGTGTFAAATDSPYTVGTSPIYVAVGDFRGVGKLDLAVTNSADNTISILLGNGDGTFSPTPPTLPPTYPTGTEPFGVAIGDFNGDGVADLAATNYNSGSTGTVSVLLGDGTGAFTAETGSPYTVGNGPTRLAAGDFNGDGIADLAVANYKGSTVSVLLNGVTQAATWSTSSPVAVPGTGASDNLEASYPGDSNFAPSMSTLASLATSAAAMSITASGASMTYGATPPTIAPLYTYYDGTNDVVNSSAPPNGTTAPACTTTATSASPVGAYPGYNTCSGAANSTYTAISYVAGTMTVTQATPTVTFGTAPTATYLGGNFTVSATTTNTDSTALSYSQVSGPCALVSGATFSSSGAGACVVQASGAATTNFTSASNTQSVTIAPADQATLTVTGPGSVTYGTTGTAAATGGSGTGALSFSAGASTGCAVTGTTVSVTNASGTCSLTAMQAADDDYNSATSAAFTVTLVKANQATLAVTGPASVTYGATGTAAASGGSGTGALSFSAGGSTGCAVTGTTVSVSNASGTCSLTAMQAADNNYNSTTSAAFTVTLVKATPTVTWATPAAITYGTTLSATQLDATSAVAGTFAYSPAAGTTPPAGTDTLSVTFTPTDTTDYTTATGSVSLPVNKATPTITWATPAAITYGATLSSTQLDATASVPGTFVYSPAAGTTPAAGTDTLSVTFTPTDTTDYNTATANVTLAVEGFAFTAASGSSTSATAAPGQPATYTLSVGGEGGFSGPVTFTCTGAPSEATCTASPNPLTAGSSAKNVTVTVTTTAPSVSTPRSRPVPPIPPLSPGLKGLFLLVLVITGIAWAFARRRQPGATRWQSRMVLLAGGLLLTLALAGCHSSGTTTTPSNPGTPAGNYTLTVKGTAGSGSSTLNQSVTLTLNVS